MKDIIIPFDPSKVDSPVKKIPLILGRKGYMLVGSSEGHIVSRQGKVLAHYEMLPSMIKVFDFDKYVRSAQKEEIKQLFEDAIHELWVSEND